MDISETKISWLKLRQIKILKTKPLSLFVYENCDEFLKIDIQKGRKGKPVTNISFRRLLSQLWPSVKPIGISKLNDITFILYLIRSDCKSVYSSLLIKI